MNELTTAKRDIERRASLPGERWKDDKGRTRIGRPLNSRASPGNYLPGVIGHPDIWVPHPFDCEGRRIIKAHACR